MYRSKDFLFMEVENITGTRIGFVKDILINFDERKIIGFLLSNYKILKKNSVVLKENIISFDLDEQKMIIDDLSKYNGLVLSSIKGMDVVDKFDIMLGMVDDIIINDNDFSINGIYISTGIINNFIKGKKIILLRDLIIGESKILYYGKKENLSFCNTPHRFIKEDDGLYENKLYYE